MLDVLGLDPLAPQWADGGRVAGPGAGDRLRDVLGSLVRLTLQQRNAARARSDYATADAIRDGLDEIGHPGRGHPGRPAMGAEAVSTRSGSAGRSAGGPSWASRARAPAATAAAQARGQGTDPARRPCARGRPAQRRAAAPPPRPDPAARAAPTTTPAAARSARARPRRRAPSGPSARAPRGLRDAPEFVAGRNPVVESLRAAVPAAPCTSAPGSSTTSGSARPSSSPPTAAWPCSRPARPSSTGSPAARCTRAWRCRVAAYDYAHPDDLLARAADAAELPLIVALDGVTDPRNLGAVARSAAAFGAHGVVVPSRRGAGVTAGAWKASAGALARVPVARAANLARALASYQDAWRLRGRPGRGRRHTRSATWNWPPPRWSWSSAPRAAACPAYRRPGLRRPGSASPSPPAPNPSTPASCPHRPLRGRRRPLPPPPPLARPTPASSAPLLALHARRCRVWQAGVVSGESELTVAVTGPTGTFGFGLMPLLQADDRMTRIVGIARRPFDPAAHGWTKMEYRRGDVRDPAALERGLRGRRRRRAPGVHDHRRRRPRDTIRAINVEGTLNAFRAAAAAGARRFVYASSVAAYGFHRDNPVGHDRGVAGAPGRPPVLRAGEGRDSSTCSPPRRPTPSRARASTCCARRSCSGRTRSAPRSCCPGRSAPLGRGLGRRRSAGSPVPLPVLAPALPLQFIHEDDVGQAFLLCVVGRRAARRLQHHRRRRADRRRRRPRARARAAAAPRPGRRRPRRAAPSPRCRSPRRRRSGSRRSATRRSWTRARPSASWAGRRATRASRRCATPCARVGPALRKCRLRAGRRRCSESPAGVAPAICR